MFRDHIWVISVFGPDLNRAYEAAFQKDPNYVETAKANRRIPNIDLPHGPIQFMGEAGDAVDLPSPDVSQWRTKSFARYPLCRDFQTPTRQCQRK